MPINAKNRANFIKHFEFLPHWYNGPSLLQALDELKPADRPINRPLRIPIKDVYDIPGVGIVVAGRVESGVIKVNDKILVAPANIVGTVKSIETDGVRVNGATVGDIIALNVDGFSSKKDVRKGSVVGHADDEPPAQVIDFIAQISKLPIIVLDTY